MRIHYLLRFYQSQVRVDYKTAAECWDGLGRLKNCSENALDGCKTAATLVGTVPKLSKKGKHNHKTATECWDGLGRLQNCSENAWDGADIKQQKANITIKLQRDDRKGQDG